MAKEEQEPVATDTSQLPTNGHSRQTQLSSNTTLILRVFLPVFGTVFFTGLLLALWLIDEEELYFPYSVWWPRTIIAVIWLGWLLLVRRVLWPLKRVDADDAYVYVTNYWTTVRYPWVDVARMQEKKHRGRKLIHLTLKGTGRFGQEIVFLPGSGYYEWMQEHGKRHLLLAN